LDLFSKYPDHIADMLRSHCLQQVQFQKMPSSLNSEISVLHGRPSPLLFISWDRRRNQGKHFRDIQLNGWVWLYYASN